MQTKIEIRKGGQSERLSFESKEGAPCICNSTFYKLCPKPSECQENQLPKRKSNLRGDFLLSQPINGHDFDDPDHVEPPFSNYDWRINLTPRNDAGSDYHNANNGYNDDDDVADYVDDDRKKDTKGDDPFGDRFYIDRHRKVYMEKVGKMVHPISLTIPVKVPTTQTFTSPRPAFRLTKHKTVENRPEIQMVPVKKTIIKPVGIPSDQIIDDSRPITSFAI